MTIKEGRAEARLYKGNDPTPAALGIVGLIFPAASISIASNRPLSSAAPNRCSRNNHRKYSSAGCSPFCALHSMHAETRLRYELHPTRARGTTWSRHSSRGGTRRKQ